MNEVDAGVEALRSAPNAAEQLAELQLLTRADHHDGHKRDTSRLGLEIRINNDSMATHEPDENDEIAIESTGSSSFTALLAASRRLAGSNSPASPPPSPPANAVDSPRHAQASTETRARRPTTMPTLSEEDADESLTEDGPESPADSTGTTGDSIVKERLGLRPSEPSYSRSSSVGGSDYLNASGERDEDEIDDNFVFEDMLLQLPYDLSFLALSVADITPRNLLRVRDALARSETVRDLINVDDPSNPKPPLEKMRLVRTMMAVDTLWLFLLRCDEEDVLRAVTDAVRQIYGLYVDDHGVGPLSHTQGVLTSSNITRAVLLVRDTLQKHEQRRSHSGNNRSEYVAKSPGRLHTGGRSSPTKSTSSVSPSSWRSQRSRSSSSPSKALSPRPSSSSSPGRSSSDSSSPRRVCSIFASDGIHVLMNEKLTAFQHRGDVNRLPSFKVRRDSAVHAEEAARRRQRSIQYASETARALRG